MGQVGQMYGGGGAPATGCPEGQRNPTGMGIGLRHQVSSRIVFDAGMGTEFYGPADRSVFFGTVGLSVGF